jgi:hypothetical protein
MAAKIGFERLPSSTFRSWEPRRAPANARLAQVVSEPIFDIRGLWKSRAISALIPFWVPGRPSEAMHASHPGAEFDVWPQAGVDEPLGVGDRQFSEPGDPGRERLYERVYIGVGQGTIHVAVGLGLLSPDVFRARFQPMS